MFNSQHFNSQLHVCECFVSISTVVQLFNAVSKHQKSIEDKLKEVGPSERKKHKGKSIIPFIYVLVINNIPILVSINVLRY